MRVPNRARSRRSPRADVRNFYAWAIGKVPFPSGAILYFDADIDAFSEQTGGVHTFNHAVLSPQYQLGADGSYSNVGARPAVDVFGGRRWLRSCRAYANAFPTGAQDFTTWSKPNNTGVVASEGAYKIIPSTSVIQQRIDRTVTDAAGTYTYTVLAKPVDYTWISIRIGTDGKPFNLSGAGAVGSAVGGVGGSAAIRLLEDGFYECSLTVTSVPLNQICRINVETGNFVGIGGEFAGNGTAHLLVKNPILTATAYPVPYVPPGVTQPASNATTTNGMWFANPDGSPLWKALTGQTAGMTLATRVRMGVGSGDLANGTSLTTLTPRADTGPFYTRKGSGGENIIVAGTDGTSFITTLQTVWPRNVVFRSFAQVNTAGTQFRVGYMIEGAHTTIQWSAWSAFDGSFNPSTLYRLMLGYNNAYPMWFNKITAWKEQVSDARILEAMA